MHFTSVHDIRFLIFSRRRDVHLRAVIRITLGKHSHIQSHSVMLSERVEDMSGIIQTVKSKAGFSMKQAYLIESENNFHIHSFLIFHQPASTVDMIK